MKENENKTIKSSNKKKVNNYKKNSKKSQNKVGVKTTSKAKKQIVNKNIKQSNSNQNKQVKLNVMENNNKTKIINSEIINKGQSEKLIQENKVEQKILKVEENDIVETTSDNKSNNIREKENNNFIWILFLILIILVLFFPKIYKYVETLKLPKVEKIENKDTNKIKEVDEDVLENIQYPLMRNSIYNVNTYYSQDKFSISDMSNEDILLSAFLDIYEGNITSYEGSGYCTNVSKQFEENYLELRIKNILGKNINYILEDFYVPEDSNSDYVGKWTYDSYNSRFVYNGLCESNVNSIKYYNLEEFIKSEYENDAIIVYYYVGFAKVEGNKYTIYNDAKMEKEIKSGTGSDFNSLVDIFKNISKDAKRIYKYTFKNDLCSYDEYCLYEGKWVDEL